MLAAAQGARVMSEAFNDPARLIDDFRGEYAFLSNFFMRELVLDGVDYRSAEHAFNVKKTLDAAAAEQVRLAPTPALAKRLGRRVPLRDGWDETVRYEVMRAVLAAKFADPDLLARLLATGDALLIEGNQHEDNHWGQCSCEQHRAWPGANHLGWMLMEHRAALRGDRADRLTRVAVTGHRPTSATTTSIRFG
jgi:ribA/ribD-fused uncharacterized protein